MEVRRRNGCTGMARLDSVLVLKSGAKGGRVGGGRGRPAPLPRVKKKQEYKNSL